MGFMEIFGLTAMIFGIAFIIWQFICGICKMKMKKQIENKIRVKNKRMGIYYAWLVIALFNTLNMFMKIASHIAKGNETDATDYFFFGILWILITIGYLMIVIFGKYGYISEDCIIIYDVSKISLNRDDFQYKISDDILEIYYKNNKTLYKYRIIENREELLNILNENYKPYKYEA